MILENRNTLQQSYNRRTLLRDIAVTVLITTLLVGFIFNIVIVNGTSMKPTLRDGSIILTNHIAPNVDHGSIVVCNTDNFGERLIKRVIGCPGDTVDIDFNEGVVYLNGDPLNEPYTYAKTYSCPDDATELPVTLGENCYFLMGDNRNNSIDSRNAVVGIIHRNDILSSYICTIF